MTLLSHDGLVPLEIWHGLVRGHLLYKVTPAERARILIEFFRDVHAGRAHTASARDTAKLKLARGFGKLVVRGGRSVELKEALTDDLPFKIDVDEISSPFAAWKGAQRVALQKRWASFCAIDLGQTGMKIMSGGHFTYLPRDLASLPIRPPGINFFCKSETTRQRRALRNWVVQAIQNVERESLDGLCLAVPASLTKEGAGSCSYVGLSGNLQEIFFDLGVDDVVFANDAVLTAFGEPACEKTLVVTIGHGLGAALWQE